MDYLQNNVDLTMVTGPSRSGKSKWAEHLAAESNNVTYIATAVYNKNDHDFHKRVLNHIKRRPKHWITLETGALLHQAIDEVNDNSTLLIDSLGGYITCNLQQGNEDWHLSQKLLVKSLHNYKSKIIIVSEEVGWGLVPMTSIGNTFRDRIGSLSYLLQQISIDSWLVIQGRAVNLRSIGECVPE